MKVFVHTLPLDPSVLGAALELQSYVGVKQTEIIGEGVGVTLILHRPQGNVGIPYLRLHHWTEEKEENGGT